MRPYLYHKFLCAGLVGLLSAGAAFPANAQINPLKDAAALFNGSSPDAIKVSMTKALEVGQVDGHRFADPQGMKTFYDARAYEAVWTQSSFFSQPKGAAILDVLDQAWEHGLNPASYHVDELREALSSASGEDKYRVELNISDALVRYGRDLTGMRVNPQAIGQLSKYWRQPLAGETILNYVSSSSNVKQAMTALAPQGKLYKSLQEELRRIYLNPTKMQKRPITLTGNIRPGARNRTVKEIRERMGFTPEQAPQGADYYDDQLAQAVMAFQKAHGSTPDGIIGEHTAQLLNMTQADRRDQILANMERLRWVEPEKPSRYIMVNVPSAMLWAVENDKVKIEMPVVVGREKRPTNIFTTEVTGIRFNPTWTVPPTIKKEDYLPKLQEDPYYLSDRGIEMMADNMTIDPGQIDWTEMSWKDVNGLRMVQGSGANNPLGLVRFIMNNPYNIYLHDTPQKSYFERTNRALSSGCIRLSDAQKLADFVLEPNEGWSESRRKEIIGRGKMTEIRASAPLPVYILYQTVWLGENGQVVYGVDIYGHDRKLLKALNDIGGVGGPRAEKSTKTAQNLAKID